MAKKLSKKTYPSGHGPSDFECFGPAATADGDFSDVMIADLGCFNQEEIDSNKFYHAAVVQSKKNKQWYAYFEWGRQGRDNPDFQFVECGDKSEAQSEFADQLHSKNDKRGVWTTIAGIKTLQNKPGKNNCYLVRSQATRCTGLPDARTIKTNDGSNGKKVAAVAPTSTKAVTKKVSAVHSETHALLRAFKIGTVAYTKSSMSNAALPTQKAIEDARQVLQAARQRVASVSSLTGQIRDKDLRDLTALMYSRIPKIKRLGAPESEWLLTENNILGWDQDLDAYESALYVGDPQSETQEEDPFGGMQIRMDYLEPKSEMGEFIRSWMPRATRDKHGGVGTMKVKNVWRVERLGVGDRFSKMVDKIAGANPDLKERPICQPPKRSDLESEDAKRYHRANVGMLFHGTRSVNVMGILREGLRLPKQLVGVVITGAMFGGGLYWADDWKKSDGYTSRRGSYWSSGTGHVKGRDAFMFVADVALGQPYVAPGPRGFTAPPPGSHCIFGKAGYSQVQNNEWIVFNPDQNQLRYLVEYDA